ncbi:hypothetical protein CYMTET_52192 [Cymbomonas tetramitiformis]|uniref:Dienelactone hydrolase domain-containing protein n=1 Tax=Cymbomonas tetramitiformis TaxID=36881 RepID=A0AAE0BL59_9CHLO|nr:hypothetical protein CYMTET_52192 [Cymbomonas tetramitiformis]
MPCCHELSWAQRVSFGIVTVLVGIALLVRQPLRNNGAFFISPGEDRKIQQETLAYSNPLSADQTLRRMPGVAGKQVAVTRKESEVEELGYLLYLPTSWTSTSTPIPLLVFLHGQGESGSDPSEVKLQGPPAVVENEPEGRVAQSFAVLSPQKTPYTNWHDLSEEVHNLTKHVLQTYSLDRQRVYLTGVSNGGFGAWALGAAHPETFAAMVPICGGGDPDTAARLKDLPVWAFHGENDVVIPVESSDKMVEAMKKAGGVEVKYSRIPDAPGRDDPAWSEAGIPTMPGHASWVLAYYGDPGEQVYQWLLSHKRIISKK